MGTYLVVANQTAMSSELREGLQVLRARDPKAEFVVLIPATPVPGVAGPQTNLTKHAEATASEVEKSLTKLGLPVVEAVAGSELPLKAIDEMMKSDRVFNGIIVSTLPPETSNWLGQDLPRLVERKWGLPVRHIIASAAE